MYTQEQLKKLKKDELIAIILESQPKAQPIEVEPVTINSYSFNNVHMGRERFGGQKYIRTKTTFTAVDDKIKIEVVYFSHRGHRDRFPAPKELEYTLTPSDNVDINNSTFEEWCKTRFDLQETLETKSSLPIIEDF